MEAFYFSRAPIYLQRDPRWANELIGGSKERLSAVGCTISAVSMALAHYGIVLPPDKLNGALKMNDGYTSAGWLKWAAISKVTHQNIFVEIPRSVTHTEIDKALQANQPVIAKILLYRTVPHWVVIIRKTEQEYLIKDPLGNGKDLELLSKFNSPIYAIRIIKHV